MADLTLDDYKRFALQQAVSGAPSVNPQIAPLQGQPSPGPMLNPAGASDGNAPPSQSPMPQQPAPTPTGAPQDQNAPPTATVTPVQQHQGPIKSFLSSFLYGAGQAMTAHVGLQTDAQKQQVAFQQGQQTQNQARQQALLQPQIDALTGKTAALQAQNAPVDLDSLGIDGLTGKVLQKDLPGILIQHQKQTAAQALQDTKNATNISINQQKYGPLSPLTHSFKDINGETYMIDKRNGEKLADLGTSNTIATAAARAKYSAMYGLTNTMDSEGNPTSVSRLEAVQNGLPSVGFDALKQIGSDRVGIAQYQDILDKQITPNLSVLRDPTQRAIIAHTLAEADKNPGALQSLLTSSAQQGLSPQGAALAAGIMQGREFGGVARKYGGNMNGTEGLMNRIMSNQASPLNSEQLNRDLIQNDRQFTQRALNTLGGITSHRKGGSAPAPSQPAPSAPASAPATSGWAGQFGGVPVKQP